MTTCNFCIKLGIEAQALERESVVHTTVLESGATRFFVARPEIDFGSFPSEEAGLHPNQPSFPYFVAELLEIPETCECVPDVLE